MNNNTQPVELTINTPLPTLQDAHSKMLMQIGSLETQKQQLVFMATQVAALIEEKKKTEIPLSLPKLKPLNLPKLGKPVDTSTPTYKEEVGTFGGNTTK